MVSEGTYHLEVEDENGQMVVREFRSYGWQPVSRSTLWFYLVILGRARGVAHGECVIYLYR